MVPCLSRSITSTGLPYSSFPRVRDHTSLVAWQLADRIALAVYETATAHWSPNLAPAWDQIRRSALSTPLNLAEGYRWRPGARWRFHLRVANGSALETTEALRFLQKLHGIEEAIAQRLIADSERCERLIWGLLRRE